MTSALEIEKLVSTEQPVIHKTIENPSELPKTPEQARELEGYLEKVEDQTERSVADDATGQALLTPAGQQTTVVIPVSAEELKETGKLSIEDQVFWYRKWWGRFAKIASALGKVIIFRK